MKLNFLFVLMLFTQAILAQYTQVTYKEGKVVKIKQWEVLDIKIESTEEVSSPYTDSSIVKFTNSDKETLDIPLIYNGGKEWLIRFSNKTTGIWKYTIESEIESLNGVSGKVSVTKNAAHKGAVRLSDVDKHHFYYETGKRYTPIAFECDWLYALDYNNDSKLPKTDHFLNLLEKNGFNQIVMNVFSYNVSWKKDEKLKNRPDHEFGGPQNIFPFLGNNETPDYSSLNIEFFKKFDRTILALHNKEIQAHLMIYVWNKLVAWPDMNSEADNMYYDYVVKRYQAFPNILWDVSKEALYYGRADEEYISERITRIKDKDAYKRLVTVHDYKFCKKHADEVDYISSQDWSHNIYNKMQEAFNTFKTKPIFNIEHGGYEESDYTVFTGDYTNAETCLRRNYMCLFAGAGTTYYWQGTSWNVLIYNPFEDEKVVYKPKYEYFKHLSSFWKQFENENLQPHPWENSSGYALGNKKGLKLFYVPKENFQIKLGWVMRKEEGKTKKYRWFNTLTGETTDFQYAENIKNFKSPWQGKADAIIVSKTYRIK